MLKANNIVLNSSSQSQKSQNQSLSKHQIEKKTQKTIRFIEPDQLKNDKAQDCYSFVERCVDNDRFCKQQPSEQGQIKVINSFIPVYKSRRAIRPTTAKFVARSFSSNCLEKTDQKVNDQENSEQRQIAKGIISKNRQTIIKQRNLGMSQRQFNVIKQVQFVTQEDAEQKQQLELSITEMKYAKINFKQPLNRHNFHLQLFSKRQEQIVKQILISDEKTINFKLMTKNFFTFQKMKSRLFLNKKIVQANDKNMQALKRYSDQFIEPILKSFTTLFSKNLQRERTDQLIIPQILENSPSSKDTINSTHPNYYHQLIPLIYCIMKDKYQLTRVGGSLGPATENYLFGKSTIHTNNIDVRAFRVFKDFDPQFNVMDGVIRGGTAQLDILIKSLYYFSYYKANQKRPLKQNQIDFSTLQRKLHLILSDYFQKTQIQIIQEVIKVLAIRGEINQQNLKRNHNFMSLLDVLQQSDSKQESIIPKNNKIRKNNPKPILNIFWVISKLLRAYKQKKCGLQRKYITISQIYGRNSEYIAYQDIYYFLQILPITTEHKKMILKKVSFYTVFWYRKDGSIPKDRLFFILDMFRLISGPSDSKRNIIQQYIVNKAQFKFMNTLVNIQKYPQKLAKYIEKKFSIRKIPEIFKRPAFILVKNKVDQRIIYSIITLIFHQLFDAHNEVSCMPILFNGLLALS